MNWGLSGPLGVVIRVALGTRRGLPAGLRGVAGAIALGLGLAVVLLTAPVAGQVHEQPGAKAT